MMKRRDFYMTAKLGDGEFRPTPEMHVPNEKISISLEFSPKYVYLYIYILYTYVGQVRHYITRRGVGVIHMLHSVPV